MMSYSDSLTRECQFFLKKETKSNHPITLCLFELTLTIARSLSGKNEGVQH